MKRAAAVAFIFAALALLPACETTGNPRQGGLFGWSEAKARQRQAERRAAVATAELRLADAQRRATQLDARNAESARELAAAADARERAAARLRLREAEIRAKASLLEQESPTAATASRARKLRSEVDALLSDRSFSARERARQLHDLEVEIDAARASVAR